MKKRLIGLLLSCAMAFSMSAPAFASNADPIAEAMQQAEVLSQKVDDLIWAGGTYQDLLDMYVAEGVISYDEMLALAEHDSAFLAKQGFSLNDAVKGTVQATRADDSYFQTYRISYSTLFGGFVGAASIPVTTIAGIMSLEIGIAAALLINAAQFAINFWMDNKDFGGIEITVRWVRYYDDNSLSWRNQPFVYDYKAY